MTSDVGDSALSYLENANLLAGGLRVETELGDCSTTKKKILLR
jgi:hypothetical protein